MPRWMKLGALGTAFAAAALVASHTWQRHRESELLASVLSSAAEAAKSGSNSPAPEADVLAKLPAPVARYLNQALPSQSPKTLGVMLSNTLQTLTVRKKTVNE